MSLIGTHLLLFTNDHADRPFLVIALSGYQSRAAPNASRDSKRSEGAFEIFCPGERTYQFVAKNSQSMHEWVEAIGESLKPNELRVRGRKPTFAEILELDSNEKMCKERMREEAEKYQDVMNSPKVRGEEDNLELESLGVIICLFM